MLSTDWRIVWFPLPRLRWRALLPRSRRCPNLPHGESAEQVPVFEQDVLPILKAHCLKCHARSEPEAGLNLSTAAGLSKGSDDGPVLIQGSAEKSVLFQKIASRTMPPPEENDPLSDEHIAVIRKWIDAGGAIAKPEDIVADSVEPDISAEDRDFWAFRKVFAPQVPEPKHAELLRTPIDAFLLEKLQARGLSFSPDASKSTLLRRAYFDLVGLPPSPDEISAFTSDSRPDAYEQLIDRLLSSPQYGERWGRHWLDVAGYTDAPHTDIAGEFLPIDDWRYRDYVVRSFNDDKPYDRFLTEQLAGDELVDWRGAARYTPEIVDALHRHRLPKNDAGLDPWRSDAGNPPLRYAVAGCRQCRDGSSRADDGLRPLPQPQIRSDSASGLLPINGDFRHGI